MKNLDNFYNISNYIIKNHETNKRNFPVLQNVNDIIDFMKNFNTKFSEIKLIDKFDTIINELLHEEDNLKENKNIASNEKENKIVDKEKKEKEITSNTNETNRQKTEGEKEIDKKGEVKDKEEFKEKDKKEIIEGKEDKEIIKDKEEFKDKEENEIIEEKEEIKGDNKIEIQKYNFADDKYEDFSISSLKEEKIYKTDYDIEKMVILDDQRILIYHEYKNEKDETKYKLCVYNNINNDFKCDISYEVDSLKGIYKMNNGNIIIAESHRIKVIKLNQKSLEIIQDIEEDVEKIFNPTEDRIIIYRYSLYDNFIFYCYEKEIIYTIEKATIVDNIYGLCSVGKDEIAIYYYKAGEIYGYYAFLLFYDIKYYTKNKTLKLGDGEEGGKIQLVNKNTLLLDRNDRIVIIDVNNRIVKKEIKIDYTPYEIIPLNEEKCLIRKCHEIIQYSINNFNLVEKERYSIDHNIVMKYPGNKLIIANEKIATIYHSNKN